MVAVIKRLCAVAALLGVLLSLVSLASCIGTEGSDTGAGARGADAVAPSETEDRDLRILMLGCDRAASLTDSILLLNVTPQTGQVRILQIPRDTYAEYTERDYKKLNGAYHTLGADGTREFLGCALGVRIDYTAVYNLDVVRAAVDAVGGVEVEIPQAMRYSDPFQNLEIDLPAGKQRLDGEKAEQFVRFRAGYANADLGRLDAQKLFLEAFLRTCRSLSPARLSGVCLTVLPQVRTDMPLSGILRLAFALLRAESPTLTIETAPGDAAKGVSGAWYYILNRDGTADRLAALTDGQCTDFDPDRVFDRPEHPEFHRIYTAPREVPQGGNQYGGKQDRTVDGTASVACKRIV